MVPESNPSLLSSSWATVTIFLSAINQVLKISEFVRSPSEAESVEKKTDQSFKEALSEAFKTKSYVLLVLTKIIRIWCVCNGCILRKSQSSV